MSEQPPNGVFRFAAFQADLRRGELRKHGLRIKLQDQPFKFLAALLEDPGEVVSRDELRERIWGTDTFVDFNRGLSSAVNRLRDALGDSADNPRYIETVARKGYRFIAPLEVPAEPAPPHEPPRRPWLRPAAALATVACAAALAFWLVRRPTPPPPPRLDQITSFIGSETMPSFSPDGRQLAFVWTGEREDNAEIYVKAIGQPRCPAPHQPPWRRPLPLLVPRRQPHRLLPHRRRHHPQAHLSLRRARTHAALAPRP